SKEDENRGEQKASRVVSNTMSGASTSSLNAMTMNAAAANAAAAVSVQPINELSVDVYDEYVPVGASAVFKCRVSNPFQRVIAWLVEQPDNANTQQQSQQQQHHAIAAPLHVSMSLHEHLYNSQHKQRGLLSSRYLMTPTGELHVRNVQLKDSNKAFRCQTRNEATKETLTSTSQGRLIVTAYKIIIHACRRLLRNKGPHWWLASQAKLCLSCCHREQHLFIQATRLIGTTVLLTLLLCVCASCRKSLDAEKNGEHSVQRALSELAYQNLVDPHQNQWGVGEFIAWASSHNPTRHYAGELTRELPVTWKPASLAHLFRHAKQASQSRLVGVANANPKANTCHATLMSSLFGLLSKQLNNMAPRIVEFESRIVARAGDDVLLPCVSHGVPRPRTTWFKEAPNGASVGLSVSQLKEADDDDDDSNMNTADPTALSSSSLYDTLPRHAHRHLIPTVSSHSYNHNNNNNIDVDVEQAAKANLIEQSVSERYAMLDSSLVIRNARPSDAARFRCVANNSLGTHAVETQLTITMPLRVNITPSSLDINVGRKVALNCTVHGHPIHAIRWFKDGRELDALPSTLAPVPGDLHNATYWAPQQSASQQQSVVHIHTNAIEASGGSGVGELGADTSNQAQSSQLPKRWSTLTIERVRRQDHGVYQCVASSAYEDAQHASAQLLLKDDAPKFVETFVSRTIDASGADQQHIDDSASDASIPGVDLSGKGGPVQSNDKGTSSVSMRCIATGSPLPELTWTLDGTAIPEDTRYRIGDFVTRDGLLVSYVNITNVKPQDGGTYECMATNEVGVVRHSARLNVTGPPFVRPMSNLTGVAGHSLTVRCPVGGAPIDQIVWLKDDRRLPLNHRQRAFANGTLHVDQLNELSDTGTYTCQARQSDQTASASFYLSIKVAPAVEPFAFAKNLHKGQRYNVMCTITRGDPPVSIRWLKDGRLIESDGRLGPTQVQSSATVDIYNSAVAMSQLHYANRRQASLEALASPFQSALQPSALLLPQDTHAHSHSHSHTGAARMSQNVQEISDELFAYLPGVTIVNVNQFSSTLVFNSLNAAQHRGSYACVATNDAGSAFHNSTLVIHEPPEWRIEPHDVGITFGRMATLDCQADGFPSPRIEWRLSQDAMGREAPTEFRPITSSVYMRVHENGSLVIYNAQRSDAGYYLCSASNGVGVPLSRVVRLTVNVAAHFNTKYRSESVCRSQTAKLRCEANGDTPLSISWLRDKQPLLVTPSVMSIINDNNNNNNNGQGPNSAVLMSDGPTAGATITWSQADGASVSELLIDKCERSHSALYTCIAQNAYGADETAIQLIVLDVPDAPRALTISEHEARSARLMWRPPLHSGNTPILRYLITYAPYTQSSPLSQGGGVGGGGGFASTSTNAQASGVSKQQHLGQADLTDLTPAGQLQQHTSTNGASVNVTVVGNETSVWLRNLTPLSEYELRLMAINAIGVSAAGEPLVFKTEDETPVAPPHSVTATPIAGRRVLVRWRAPPVAPNVRYGLTSGYYVGYRRASSSSTSNSARTSSSSSSNEIVYDNQRATFVYKTIDYYSSLVSATSPSSTTITTATVTNNAIKQQSASDTHLTINGPMHETVLSGLKRQRKYQIVVQPFNARGAGPASEPVSVETWRHDAPDAPVSTRIVGRTSHSLQLAWSMDSDNDHFTTMTHTTGGSAQNSLSVAKGTPNSAISGISDTDNDNNANLDDPIDGFLVRVRRSPSPVSLTTTMINSAQQQQQQSGVNNRDQIGSKSSSMFSINNHSPFVELDIAHIANDERVSFQHQHNAKNNNSNNQTVNNSDDDEMRELRVAGDARQLNIDQLRCGTRYALHIVAYNQHGHSERSTIVYAKTEGSTPVAPARGALLTVNASAATINLGAWHDGACPMRSFDIHYKPSRAHAWIALTNVNIPSSMANNNNHNDQQQPNTAAHTRAGSFQTGTGGASADNNNNNVMQQQQQQQPSFIVLDELTKSLSYDLKIVANNEAGATEAQYSFLTGNNAALDAPLDTSLTGGNGADTLTGENLAYLMGSVASCLVAVLAALGACSALIGKGQRRSLPSSNGGSSSLGSSSRSYYDTPNVHPTSQPPQASSTNHQQHVSPLKGNSLMLMEGPHAAVQPQALDVNNTYGTTNNANININGASTLPHHHPHLSSARYDTVLHGPHASSGSSLSGPCASEGAGPLTETLRLNELAASNARTLTGRTSGGYYVAIGSANNHQHQSDQSKSATLATFRHRHHNHNHHHHHNQTHHTLTHHNQAMAQQQQQQQQQAQQEYGSDEQQQFHAQTIANLTTSNSLINAVAAAAANATNCNNSIYSGPCQNSSNLNEQQTCTMLHNHQLADYAIALNSSLINQQQQLELNAQQQPQPQQTAYATVKHRQTPQDATNYPAGGASNVPVNVGPVNSILTHTPDSFSLYQCPNVRYTAIQ
ncbi:Down syndrome cell adhesion molecule-like protein, partial [Fragariocoptes setiger]